MENFRKEFKFPDGSYHCQSNFKDNEGAILINCQDGDLIKLALQKDALKRSNPLAKMGVLLPYVRYSRQDRICNEGEPFSIKVYTDILNSLGFDLVQILCPHSDVTPALINNVYTVELQDLVEMFILSGLIEKWDVSVAPDAGASKRTFKIAEKFKTQFLQANKIRDVSDGKILKIEVPQELDPDLHYVIFDDVCAMGGTFAGLYDEMASKGAKKIDLFVAHVDSERNGITALAEKFHKIYTTNSQANFDFPENVVVMDLFA
jgi:ribose-phosphate pyrophosphokinase